MRPTFYDDPEYTKKQSEIAKRYRTLHPKFIPPIIRTCRNTRCLLSFQVKKKSDPKMYCGRSCSASINNLGRQQSIETRQKISTAIKALPPGYYQKFYLIKNPPVSLVCQNTTCNKKFEVYPPYLAKTRRYCSNKCTMQIVGRMTTSPKASKGKPGIRSDIDPNICFYSTWEANIARVFNLLHIEWQYAPTIFDLGQHTYRPDFYLPNEDKYIEVKNFMGNYSKERDKLFRKKYPQVQLEILSKEEYQQIKEHYQSLIDYWE